MKRLLIFLLAAVLACTLTGCPRKTCIKENTMDNITLGDFLHDKNAMAKTVAAIKEKGGSEKLKVDCISFEIDDSVHKGPPKLSFYCRDPQIANQEKHFAYTGSMWRDASNEPVEVPHPGYQFFFFDINKVNLTGIPDLMREVEKTALTRGIEKPVVYRIDVLSRNIGADAHNREIYMEVIVVSGPDYVATAFADAQAKMTEFKRNW